MKSVNIKKHSGFNTPCESTLKTKQRIEHTTSKEKKKKRAKKDKKLSEIKKDNGEFDPGSG